MTKLLIAAGVIAIAAMHNPKPLHHAAYQPDGWHIMAATICVDLARQVADTDTPREAVKTFLEACYLGALPPV